MTLATLGLGPFEMRVRLALYRQNHVIEPVNSLNGNPLGLRCGHDSIRILPRKGGGWRHDPDEIRALAEGGGQ